MTDVLQQTFNDFAHGVTSPETFQHELLMLCKTTPDRAWEALALLDQHFRRGKIARELEQALRPRMQRQALGIESYQYQPVSQPKVALASTIPVAPDADVEDPTIETIASSEPPSPPAIAPAPEPAPPPAAAEAIIAELPARVAVLALERVAMRGTIFQVPQKIGAVAASARWRPYCRISPAIALTAVMLAVAASPTVKDGQDNWLTVNAAAGAALRDGNTATSSSQADQGLDVLSLSSERYIVDPDSSVAELSVERSPEAAGDTSFLWWTEGSGAKPNEDFVAGKPRRVQMTAGIGSSTLQIPILANPKRRHVEMFYVLIGRPEGNTAIGRIHRAAVFVFPPRAR